MKRKTKTIVGTINHRQKNISLKMISAIKRYQKHLQIQENIKYGRKARSISFVFATHDPKGFAKFLMEENRR